jgi:hypothetical protein
MNPMNLMNPTKPILGAFALAFVISGCNRSAETAVSPNPPVTATTPGTQNPTPDTQHPTPIKDSVEAFLAKHTDGKLLPKNVRLLSVNLEDKVASLDFSSEFNALANMGDSTEAEVQKELRGLLAKFPTVEKMSVTVEGNPFDSQMTDWKTPFPVRDEENDDVSQKPDENGGGQ